MEIYPGTQPQNSPFEQSNRPKDVVLRLISHLENSGRNITADNWFSSVPLVRELLERGITYVGTLRKNKRELPPELLSKKRIAHSSIFAFRDDMTVVSYAPKRNRCVVLVSSMHFDAAIDPDTLDKSKPDIITFYNSTKSGVDVVDEKCGTYSTCQRWPLVLFYHLLDIAGINGQVIFLSNCQEEKVMERRKFLREVGLEMIKPHVAKRATVSSHRL
ncbi:uncharacterized protein LOC124374768 [Homalodisca vitripennis]|uniref:uncharacterized protein LOC124374768 n=1 Tax=Homalodisca vitripennis TaxID=197043 RepID=UPI001EECF0E8|nr:uncharacterized protein LOC124374768 [Homalodisca vitripennis]